MRCLSITGVSPSIKFAGAHLCTWLERGTVRVACLVQDHKTMPLVGAQTWTAKSGGEYTNNEANEPMTTCNETNQGQYYNNIQYAKKIIVRLFSVVQNGFPKRNKCTFKKVHLVESTNIFTAKSALTAFFVC